MYLLPIAIWIWFCLMFSDTPVRAFFFWPVIAFVLVILLSPLMLICSIIYSFYKEVWPDIKSAFGFGE